MATEEELSEAGKAAVEELREFVDRMERVNQVIADAKDDAKALMEEVVGAGYDRKAFNHIIRIRAKGENGDEDSFQMIVDTYKAALGMA